MAKKNDEYIVYLIVHDWISVSVKAKDEEEAKIKAEKKANSTYNDKNIDCIAGTTKYIGIYNYTLTKGIN